MQEFIIFSWRSNGDQYTKKFFMNDLIVEHNVDNINHYNIGCRLSITSDPYINDIVTPNIEIYSTLLQFCAREATSRQIAYIKIDNNTLSHNIYDNVVVHHHTIVDLLNDMYGIRVDFTSEEPCSCGFVSNLPSITSSTTECLTTDGNTIRWSTGPKIVVEPITYKHFADIVHKVVENIA